MDNYQVLMCVKGLIMAMDEERYKYFQKDLLSQEMNKQIVDSFYKAILEQFNTPEKRKEDING